MQKYEDLIGLIIPGLQSTGSLGQGLESTHINLQLQCFFKALRLTLQGLQPKDSLLKDFDSCQQWLQTIKALSITVDLILSEDSFVMRHAENAADLTAEIR